MITKILSGKKIAVLVETGYISQEIKAYQKRFSQLGATVHLMSRLKNGKSACFVSNVDELKEEVAESIDVNINLQDVDVDDYAAIIMPSNQVSVRLRYFQPNDDYPIMTLEQARSAPAVRFFAQAMTNPKIIKGFLSHGLWILTPMPELLRRRRVICNEIVLADIINAGAFCVSPSSQSQPNDPRNIVVDGDLVTGRAVSDVNAFIEAITNQIAIQEQQLQLLSYEQKLRQLEADKLRLLL